MIQSTRVVKEWFPGPPDLSFREVKEWFSIPQLTEPAARKPRTSRNKDEPKEGETVTEKRLRKYVLSGAL
jgi:hypothetical protein